MLCQRPHDANFAHFWAQDYTVCGPYISGTLERRRHAEHQVSPRHCPNSSQHLHIRQVNGYTVFTFVRPSVCLCALSPVLRGDVIMTSATTRRIYALSERLLVQHAMPIDRFDKSQLTQTDPRDEPRHARSPIGRYTEMDAECDRQATTVGRSVDNAWPCPPSSPCIVDRITMSVACL